jgi:hypothetical protein
MEEQSDYACIVNFRNGLAELNGMKWTTEPPTQEGLYRAKDINGWVSWVLVDANLYVYEFREDSEFVLQDYTHWLGPIPPPELPKEIAWRRS